MQIRCPHCHQPIELVNDDPSGEMSCESCGSAFNLAADSETVGDDGSHAKTIAHFTLIDRLGQGAFGSVWKARDTELDRTVAIKIPRKDGLSSTEAEQFLREARAAAQLRHSNIVPVHEVGREDGTLYIVSDFVEGLSLADWLTGQQLTAKEAIELCVTVADALHHAHEAGVIHRDLKPANIMLDDARQPHIMDFGLARRVAGEITMTVEGKLLGTPAYMPPEQARGDGHNADRRSDLYSLGVILFELLTGEKPFRGNVRMLLHQVLNEEAPSPRKLNQSVPRDLETITLKCLQKDPDRRYQSAAELVVDLRHWLDREPINARPISAVERSWRWCCRKPALAGMWSIAMLLLLTLGIGGSLFALQQSQMAAQQTANAARQAELRQEAEDERNNAVIARKLAESNAAEARRAKELAEHNADVAREQTHKAESARETARRQTTLALNTLDTVIFQIQNRLENIPGAAAVRRELLSLVLLRLKEISDEFANADTVDRQTLVAFNNLADVFSRAGLGSENDKLSAVAFARSLREQAHTIALKLAAADPADLQAKRDLAISYGGQGRDRLRAGRIEDALDSYRSGFEMIQGIAKVEPNDEMVSRDSSVWLMRLGDVSLRAGRVQDAIDYYEQAIAFTRKVAASDPENTKLQRDLSYMLGASGDVYLQMGEVYEALGRFLDEHKILQQLAMREPTDGASQRQLSISYNKLGDVSLRVGKPSDALVFYRDGLDITKKLAAFDATDASAQRDLAISYGRIGSVALQMGQLKEAGRYYLQQRDILQRLAAADPNDVKAQRAVLLSCHRLGTVSLRSGALQLAFDFYRIGHEIAAKLAMIDPTDAQAQRDLSVSLQNLATVKRKLEQPQDAFTLVLQKLEIVRKLTEIDNNDSRVKRDLSNTYNDLGDLSREVDKTLEAQGFYQQGFEVTQQLAKVDPTDNFAQQNLSISYERLGDVNMDLNHVEIASEFYRRSHEIRLQLATIDPSDTVAQKNLSIAYSRLGDASLRTKSVSNALGFYLKAFELAKQISGSDLKNAEAQNLLINSHYKLGQVYSAMFDYSLAGNQYRVGIEALNQMIKAGQDVENAKRDRDVFLRQARASSRAIIATGDWSELLNHSKAELSVLLSVRCTELAKQGRIEDVAQAADSLMALSADAIESKSDMLYDAACGYGLCALAHQDAAGIELTEEKQTRRTEYRNLSLNCFKEAVAAGFDHFDYAEKDPDLAALHELPEFQELLTRSTSASLPRRPAPPPLPEPMTTSDTAK